MIVTAQINGFYNWPELLSIQEQQAAFQEAINQIRPAFNHCLAERLGLYTQTLDGGSEASIALWKEALDKAPRFANPRGFPWSLPSSFAGFVAIQLGLRGPNYTFVGAQSVFFETLDQALWDLTDRVVDHALVLTTSGLLGNQLGMNALLLSAVDSTLPPKDWPPVDRVLTKQNLDKKEALVPLLFSDFANKNDVIHFEDQLGSDFQLWINQQCLTLRRIHETIALTDESTSFQDLAESKP